jgi:hypothetical protein
MNGFEAPVSSLLNVCDSDSMAKLTLQLLDHGFLSRRLRGVWSSDGEVSHVVQYYQERHNAY